ncbi:hypothetical protein Pelo_19597 [Pelomyxa schiedti]|nr:hypothetical protein Pelo_19597 [Pelomyxa schiedti]
MKYEYSAELEPSGDSQSLWVDLCTVSGSPYHASIYIASIIGAFKCLHLWILELLAPFLLVYLHSSS